MKTPKIKKVKIGSSYYDVEYVDKLIDEHGKELSGKILFFLHLIKVDKSISHQSMLQVIHHESTHGIMWEYAIEDEKDIDLVTPMSNGFYAFIIDNSEFIREILKHAEEIKKWKIG